MPRRSRLALLAASALLISACAGASTQSSRDLGGGEEAPVPAVGMPQEASGGKGFVGDGTGSPSAVNADSQRIVRTGSMDLVVKDVPAATEAARVAIEGMGGHISASQASGDQTYPSATVTYRVPVERYDDAVAAVRALGLRLEGEQSQAVEVTGQVADLDARLANLRATEAALQSIMAQATKIPDILAVQEQLTQVRGQIEQLEAQKAQLEDAADLSTLTVAYRIDVPATKVTTDEWDPAQIVDHSVSILIGLAQGLVAVLIVGLIVGVPIALVAALVLGLIAGLARLVRRRRRSDKATPGGETPAGTTSPTP